MIRLCDIPNWVTPGKELRNEDLNITACSGQVYTFGRLSFKDYLMGSYCLGRAPGFGGCAFFTQKSVEYVTLSSSIEELEKSVLAMYGKIEKRHLGLSAALHTVEIGKWNVVENIETSFTLPTVEVVRKLPKTIRACANPYLAYTTDNEGNYRICCVDEEGKILEMEEGKTYGVRLFFIFHYAIYNVGNTISLKKFYLANYQSTSLYPGKEVRIGSEIFSTCDPETKFIWEEENCYPLFMSLVGSTEDTIIMLLKSSIGDSRVYFEEACKNFEKEHPLLRDVCFDVCVYYNNDETGHRNYFSYLLGEKDISVLPKEISSTTCECMLRDYYPGWKGCKKIIDCNGELKDKKEGEVYFYSPLIFMKRESVDVKRIASDFNECKIFPKEVIQEVPKDKNSETFIERLLRLFQ